MPTAKARLSRTRNRLLIGGLAVAILLIHLALARSLDRQFDYGRQLALEAER